MKGIPKDDNFVVFNKLTNEIEHFKTLNEIANKYNTNYYTAYSLSKYSNEANKKMGRKLKALYDMIEINTIF